MRGAPVLLAGLAVVLALAAAQGRTLDAAAPAASVPAPAPEPAADSPVEPPLGPPVEAPAGQPAVDQLPRGTYSLADVEKHNSETNCWMAIKGKVYDLTEWVPVHPGGPIIIKFCGGDVTNTWEHRDDPAAPAWEYLPDYKIGKLAA